MPTATVPGTRITLLTVTSKMPSRSWSLPAFKACPSAYLGENARIMADGERVNVDKGTICGNCYAGKGAYAWAPVKRAQDARMAWTRTASMDPSAGDAFVATQTAAIDAEADRQVRKWNAEIARGDREMGTFPGPVFRVHDSGDLFSPSYAKLWVRIAQALPDVRFWFPTRQWRSKNVHMQAALRELAALPNVAVRPSALRFEDEAPIIDGLSAGTTASGDGFTCPASRQDGKCLDCRACWSKTGAVSYRKH